VFPVKQDMIFKLLHIIIIYCLYRSMSIGLILLPITVTQDQLILFELQNCQSLTHDWEMSLQTLD
jgi:hypothetical protein